MFIFLKYEMFFGQPFWSHCGVISRKLLIKSRNQEKLKLNPNLQRLPFKMMHNKSMLCHRFSNEPAGGGVRGGRPELPSSLIL